MFDSKPVEILNEETGEVKKQQVMYYPDMYKDCIGKSYTDYVEGKQMTIFEYLDEYTGKSYTDMSEEEQKQETEEKKESAELDQREVFLPKKADSDHN